MSINDKLKKAVDAIDLDRALAEARSTAGELARKHGGKVDETLGKVGDKVDAKTQGKYADKLAAARQKINEGVAKVAEQPPTDQPPADGEPGDARTEPPSS